MALSPEATHGRAKVARLAQSYPPDHPKVVEARQNFKALRLEEHVQKALSEAPPLTSEQRDRIAAILRAGTGDANALASAS